MLMPPSDVKTIDRQTLQSELALGRIKLVMALNDWAFRAKHIPGSLHFDAPADLLAALGKDDDIVVYCSQESCHSSVAMYQELIEHGYRRVRRYSGGLADWEAAGLPLEGEWVDAARASEETDHG